MDHRDASPAPARNPEWRGHNRGCRSVQNRCRSADREFGPKHFSGRGFPEPDACANAAPDPPGATTRQNRKETAVASLRSEPDITMFTRQFTNLANVSVPDHMRTKNVTSTGDLNVPVVPLSCL